MKISSNLIATLILATPLAGMALNPQPLPPGEHALNLPGATTTDAPPAGFDPITASDADLDAYKFPPRPNQNTEPKAYATWVKAMNASKTRMVPQIEQTTIFHGPAKPGTPSNPTAVEKITAPAGDVNNLSYSYNWSGYVDFSGAASYGTKSFYYLVNDFVVPVAEQAGCDGGWDWGSAWNGIDGWGSNDVLQSGIEFDAYCALGGLAKSTFYSAWYEWYPYGEVRIGGFPIAPGDDMFIETWHTSSTQGYAYLVNYNNNQAVEVGFTAYPGYPLVGNSAEWIVERPSVGGSLTNLTDYKMLPFWDAYAYTETYAFYDIGTATPVDMLTSTNTLYSYPEYVGPEAFVAHYY